jgi:hypothetical protein
MSRLHRPSWSLITAIAVALAGGAMGALLVGLANVVLAVVGVAGGVGLGAYAGAILGGLIFGDEGEGLGEEFVQEVQAGRTLAPGQIEDREGARAHHPTDVAA